MCTIIMQYNVCHEPVFISQQLVMNEWNAVPYYVCVSTVAFKHAETACTWVLVPPKSKHIISLWFVLSIIHCCLRLLV